MVVEAVRTNRFLLLTHPEQVHEIIVRRADDPDQFLADQIAALVPHPGA